MQKGPKGARTVKGDANDHSHEAKNSTEPGKEKTVEENAIPDDDMIQLDIDMVQLAEDTEPIEELK